MEDDDLVRAFKKYVKDDTQHPTPEEDMADYLHDLFKFSHPDGLTVKGNAKVAVQDEAKVDPQDKAKIAVKDKPKLVVKDNTRAPVEDNARIVVQHKTDIIFDKDSDVDQQPYNEGDGELHTDDHSDGEPDAKDGGRTMGISGVVRGDRATYRSDSELDTTDDGDVVSRGDEEDSADESDDQRETTVWTDEEECWPGQDHESMKQDKVPWSPSLCYQFADAKEAKVIVD
ncbi:hypothetical protein BGZ54_005406, partial [Gamsiella multidivaricata]